MNRTRSHILALDQGTTSSRAIGFDALGQAVSVAQREFPQTPAGSRFIDPGKSRLSPGSTPTPLSQIAFPAKPSMPKASLRFTRAKAFVNKSQNSKPYT